jgi:hypothetical protein
MPLDHQQCCICFEWISEPSETIVSICCANDHVLCVDCLIGYVQHILQQTNPQLNIPCPGRQKQNVNLVCNAFISTVILQRFLPLKLMKQYDQQCVEEATKKTSLKDYQMFFSTPCCNRLFEIDRCNDCILVPRLLWCVYGCKNSTWCSGCWMLLSDEEVKLANDATIQSLDTPNNTSHDIQEEDSFSDDDDMPELEEAWENFDDNILPLSHERTSHPLVGHRIQQQPGQLVDDDEIPDLEDVEWVDDDDDISHESDYRVSTVRSGPLVLWVVDWGIGQNQEDSLIFPPDSFTFINDQNNISPMVYEQTPSLLITNQTQQTTQLQISNNLRLFLTRLFNHNDHSMNDNNILRTLFRQFFHFTGLSFLQFRTLAENLITQSISVPRLLNRVITWSLPDRNNWRLLPNLITIFEHRSLLHQWQETIRSSSMSFHHHDLTEGRSIFERRIWPTRNSPRRMGEMEAHALLSDRGLIERGIPRRRFDFSMHGTQRSSFLGGLHNQSINMDDIQGRFLSEPGSSELFSTREIRRMSHENSSDLLYRVKNHNNMACFRHPLHERWVPSSDQWNKRLENLISNDSTTWEIKQIFQHYLDESIPKCPSCKTAGIKSDSCNEIDCSVCNTKWCFVCSRRLELRGSNYLNALENSDDSVAFMMLNNENSTAITRTTFLSHTNHHSWSMSATDVSKRHDPFNPRKSNSLCPSLIAMYSDIFKVPAFRRIDAKPNHKFNYYMKREGCLSEFFVEWSAVCMLRQLKTKLSPNHTHIFMSGFEQFPELFNQEWVWDELGLTGWCDRDLVYISNLFSL